MADIQRWMSDVRERKNEQGFPTVKAAQLAMLEVVVRRVCEELEQAGMQGVQKPTHMANASESSQTTPSARVHTASQCAQTETKLPSADKSVHMIATGDSSVDGERISAPPLPQKKRQSTTKTEVKAPGLWSKGNPAQRRVVTQHPNTPHTIRSPSGPLIRCLHGGPGTGKSYILKLIK